MEKFLRKLTIGCRFKNHNIKNAIPVFLFFIIISINAKAQHPWMIKDINATGTANGPVGSANSTSTQWNKMYTANGYGFFIANDGVHGEEIWRTDGTAAGTFMLADITPGAGSTTFGSFYTVGNLLYFGVQKNNYTLDVTGLWRTDGTINGTYAIMTKTGGHNISSENAFEVNDGAYNQSTRLGNYYYFTVTDTLAPINYNGSTIQNVHSRIYKTDGTTAGTTVYYDAGMIYWANYAGGSYGTIDRIIAMGGNIYIFGINNTTLAAYLQQGNGGPSQYVISAGDGTTTPSIIYAPGGNNGAVLNHAVNVNDNYLLATGYLGGNGAATSLYRLKPGETTPVVLGTGTSVSLFAGTGGGGQTSSAYYANNGIYFFGVSSLLWATNGDPAGTFAISGINAGALYTGILDSKMTFYANDDKLYSWDGVSPASYQVVSDSLTGKHINRVLQIAGRAYFLNNYGMAIVQTSDLSGAGCLTIYPGGFLGSGTVIHNNYVDFAFGVDGGFNAGDEPYLLNTPLNFLLPQFRMTGTRRATGCQTACQPLPTMWLYLH